MLVASFFKHTLKFKRPSGTSRGILTEKPIWILEVWNEKKPHIKGRGECSPIFGLSLETPHQYEDKIKNVCAKIDDLQHTFHSDLAKFPSIRMGVEMALNHLKNNGQYYFKNQLNQRPIQINGLVWMGKPDFMIGQIKNKIQHGFKCIKIKIGAIEFEQELDILKFIRQRFSKEKIEIRVDANGGFSPENALGKLVKLSQFDLHSIEQPIAPKQHSEMKRLCQKSPIPIALDEELIHLTPEKKDIVEFIQPQYLILKPSLLGGFAVCQKWIDFAQKHNMGWWATSALESNIGLEAIAEWTSFLSPSMPQGLGTGHLFTNNFETKLELNGQWLSKKI